MTRNALARKNRKQRRTFTLSPEVIAIIEAEKRERQVESASSVVEDLLKEGHRQKELADVAASISSFYDSLTNEQAEEQRLWGEFAESQLPSE